VKYEDIYLNGYSTMGELLLGLTKYFDFYNSERPHQALENQTPESVYKSARGGGAMIIEKFNKTAPEKDVPVMAENQGSAVQLCV
jgi:putative transposase